MKLEIDSRINKVNQRLIISVVSILKGLYYKENKFDNKALLDNCIKSLQQVYNNIDEHTNKSKPIRKISITNK